jgi:phosphocarrier protein HPr
MLMRGMMRTFTMTHPEGLHARTASLFIKVASRFDADILVGRSASWVNGKSILGLLTLSIGAGDELTVVADGADAEEAMRAITTLFRRCFQEASLEAESIVA